MEEVASLLSILAVGILVYGIAELFSGISSLPSEWLEDHEYYSLKINEYEYDDYPGLDRGDGIFDLPEKSSDFRWYHSFTIPFVVIVCMPLFLLTNIPILKYPAEWLLNALFSIDYHFKEKRSKSRMKKWRRKMVKEAQEGRLKIKERPVKETPVEEPPVTDELSGARERRRKWHRKPSTVR